MQTLITAAEAVRYTPVNADFPTAKLCQQIPAEELNAFVQYIGFDFYERLKADLIDYSAAPAWIPGDSYADGDKVVYGGIVYESLIAANTQPIGDPLNLTAWKEADKFNTACFNDLWIKGFLREFLAFTVVGNVLPHVTYPTGSIGTIQKFDDQTGIKTVENPNYGKVVESLHRDRMVRLQLVVKYIQDNSATCDFSGSLYSSDCDPVIIEPRMTRRTFFRH
jgi:hypothetical protein